MHIGKQIRSVQADNSMKCMDLAERLGVAPQQLSRWRRAEDLKLSIVKQVADVFGLSVDDLINYGKKEAGK
jgi:DNA-binding Xre family transcriptional regulator